MLRKHIGAGQVGAVENEFGFLSNRVLERLVEIGGEKSVWCLGEKVLVTLWINE